jgi:hypothetical protein
MDGATAAAPMIMTIDANRIVSNDALLDVNAVPVLIMGPQMSVFIYF